MLTAPSLALPVPQQRSTLLRRSLKISTAEGMVAECVTAFTGGAVTTAWGLHLGCSPSLVGVLAALPFVVQPVQLPAAWLTGRLGPKRACLWLVGSSRALLALLALIPLLPDAGRTRQHAFALVWTAHALLSVAGNNAWSAWMADLVPARLRGAYFGRRTAWSTLSATVASLATGRLLDAARERGEEGTLLALLALLAVVAGAVCAWLMTLQAASGPASHAPGPAVSRAHPEADISLGAALRYQVVFQAGSGLGTGYFALFAVEHLGLGFGVLALYGATVAAVKTWTAPAWGRAVDRLGSVAVLRWCSWGFAASPLLWLLPTPGFAWPLALDAVFNGAVGAGHAVASFHLPLSLQPSKGRAWVLAQFSAAGGIGWAAGAAVGGLALAWFPPEASGGARWTSLHAVFLMMALVRAAAATRLEAPGRATASA
jgi:MFS family permease